MSWPKYVFKHTVFAHAESLASRRHRPNWELAGSRGMRWVVAIAALLSTVNPRSAVADEAARLVVEPIAINDNRRAAGTLEGDTLVMKLRAGVGAWRPEGDEGPALQVEAFGEVAATAAGAGAADPGAGRAPRSWPEHSQRSRSHALRVHGLCTRDSTPCAPLEVPAPASVEVRFRSGRAGTYHYWATTTACRCRSAAHRTRNCRARSSSIRPGVTAPPDRVLVITEWTSLTREQLFDSPRRRFTGADSSRSIPGSRFSSTACPGRLTERLTLSPWRGRPLAHRQPEHAGASDAPARLLFHGRRSRRRAARHAFRRRPEDNGSSRSCSPRARRWR